MELEEWLEYGWSKGWITPPVCYTHDGLPTTESEMDEWNEGSDPCIHIVRLYEDQEQRRQVESNDPPTVWRASNRGWKR